MYDIENKEYTKFENWNKSEVKKFVQGLLEEVFDFPKKRSEAAWGSVRNCFLEAYTHRGLISYSDQLPRENCMVFDCPTDGHLSGFLEYLKNQLVEAGIDVIALHHPLCAGYLSHLYCPEQGLLLTGDQSLGSVTEVGDLLNHNHYRQYHKGLHEHAICQKLIEGAIHQLKHAKMMHDELEAVYIEHMDFNKWEEKFRETLASI
ncbi:MAG: hypothetical protein GX567_04995 [Clostridia bacterium]|nr:hypothetical protein [Clostridia bacterium]